ncbi:F-box/LRR-repeat protein 2 [Porphyridium purpureum]|uniref:F-box/LRR-repeat protein 2 n=1 Tax=Porphyridium purpureum TaxID=35688 RepID=A0A5J4YP35_PORPP|nr:F-box/LRR-repeat protein 2 [Porphyridium purpureum]|eukprot:POR7870..scf295_9
MPATRLELSAEAQDMLDLLPNDVQLLVLQHVAELSRREPNKVARSHMGRQREGGGTEDELDEQNRHGGLVLDSHSLRLLYPLTLTCRALRRAVVDSVIAFAPRDHGYLMREDLIRTASQFQNLKVLDLSVMFSSTFSASTGVALKLSLSAAVFKLLADKCRKLEIISLSGCTSLPGQLGSILAGLPKLYELDVSTCFMRTNVLAGLERSLSLRSLDCRDCERAGLNRDFCLDTIPQISQLAKLFVGHGGKAIDDEFLRRIRGLKQLCVLDLEGCRGITDQGIASFAGEDGLPHLQVLTLSNCPQLTNKSIASCASSMPKLVKLEVSFNPRVESAAIVELCTLSQMRRTLRTLSLVNCSGLNSDFAGGIRQLDAIQRLNLSALTTISALLPLSECAESLEELDISYCVSVDRASLIALARHPNLRALSLAHCSNVDESVLASFREHRTLEDLDISGCDRLSSMDLCRSLPTIPNLASLHADFVPGANDAFIRAMVRGSCRNALTCVSLKGCMEVSDLHALLSLPNVKSLDVTRCSIQLSADETIALPAAHGLTNLNLTGNSLLHDTDLARIARACPNLVKLDCSSLSWITDAGIEALVACLPKLKYLKLSHCALITHHAVQTIASGLSNLQSIEIHYNRVVGGVRMREFCALHDADASKVLAFYITNGGNSESLRAYHYEQVRCSRASHSDGVPRPGPALPSSHQRAQGDKPSLFGLLRKKLSKR